MNKQHRREHRDAISRSEREYRRRHCETYNQKKRGPGRLYYWMKKIETLAGVPTTPCDCGLCLVCGGFETESWSRGFIVPRSDPIETLELRLDRMDAFTACWDTSSELDPRLEEELARVLNEASSDEALELAEEEDVEDVMSCFEPRDDGGDDRIAVTWSSGFNNSTARMRPNLMSTLRHSWSRQT